jgi:hypothetical protein
MTAQLDLFGYRHSAEFFAWLQSPPGTMAPWVAREMTTPKRKRHA